MTLAVSAYSQTMINLMDGGRRHPGQSRWGGLQYVALTAGSITGAVILLPLIGLKAFASSIPVASRAFKMDPGQEHYLIN